MRKIKNMKTITPERILEIEREGYMHNFDKENSPFESFEEMQEFRDRKLIL